jgi:hypothetical protein
MNQIIENAFALLKLRIRARNSSEIDLLGTCVDTTVSKHFLAIGEPSSVGDQPLPSLRFSEIAAFIYTQFSAIQHKCQRRRARRRGEGNLVVD